MVESFKGFFSESQKSSISAEANIQRAMDHSRALHSIVHHKAEIEKHHKEFQKHSLRAAKAKTPGGAFTHGEIAAHHHELLGHNIRMHNKATRDAERTKS